VSGGALETGKQGKRERGERGGEQIEDGQQETEEHGITGGETTLHPQITHPDDHQQDHHVIDEQEPVGLRPEEPRCPYGWSVRMGVEEPRLYTMDSESFFVVEEILSCSNWCDMPIVSCTCSRWYSKPGRFSTCSSSRLRICRGMTFSRYSIQLYCPFARERIVVCNPQPTPPRSISPVPCAPSILRGAEAPAD